MFKKILFIILSLLIAQISFAYDAYLPKGTLIKVYPRIPISTEFYEEGDTVYFSAPADVWVLESKAVESGDIFKGYISMLKMPIQGVNATMKIDITNILKKDGSSRDFKGKIIFATSDTLGGNLTQPASYRKVIHPRKVYGAIWGGTMQYVPSGEYEFGSHVGITVRDSIFIETQEDYYLD